MNYSSVRRSEPFADWLDVTCSPACSFISDLMDFLDLSGCSIEFSDKKSVSYSVGYGILRLETKDRFHRASASGKCIDWLKAQGLFRDYVNILGSVGHKVTRLDVAVDVCVDAPLVLRELESVYPNDTMFFGRKGLRITRLYSAREGDLAQTGTWYAGHKSSARVTCRVYDKQNEILVKQGLKVLPLTRFEITFRKDYGCSLFDVLMPKSLFYSHSTPILSPPDGFNEDWESRGTVPWVSEPVDTTVTVSDFDRRISLSPDFQRLVELASRFGPNGKAVLMRHFERALDSALSQNNSESDSTAA